MQNGKKPGKCGPVNEENDYFFKKQGISVWSPKLVLFHSGFWWCKDITLCTKSNVAYGIFYDNLSTSVFNMGQEIDAYHGAYHFYKADFGSIFS